MTVPLDIILSGVLLGLSGGLAPGPLMALVISESLRSGISGGIKVAIAPLITDLPIIILSLLVLYRLANIDVALGLISLAGGTYLAYLGIDGLRFKGIDLDTESVRSDSLKKGIIANFLNPSPYLFWFSIGAPLIVKASARGLTAPAAFIIIFYVMLIGSKAVLAMVVGHTRGFLKSHHYIYTLRILGLLLAVFAVFFIKDGLELLN